MLADRRPGDFSAGSAKLELRCVLIQQEYPYMVGVDKIFGGLCEAGKDFGKVKVFRYSLVQLV